MEKRDQGDSLHELPPAEGDRRTRRLCDLDAASQLRLVSALQGYDAERARDLAKQLGVDLEAVARELHRGRREMEAALDGSRKSIEQAITRGHRAASLRRWFRSQPAESTTLVAPPRLLGGTFLRKILRPADYKRMIEPHIADMHEEYFACLVKKDERGARWAVIRGNLYAVPSWAWGLAAQVVARVIEWMRT